MPNARNGDRRVQRTQKLLHGALASLIHEKPYEEIVVKEILARADVGRSTFYSHFRDKDDLLDNGIRDTLRASERSRPTRTAYVAEDVLRFSLPVFEHIHGYRRSCAASSLIRSHAVVHERLGREVADLLVAELKQIEQRRPGNGQRPPDRLVARHVAASFLVVLGWWLEHDEHLSPDQANDLFVALVSPTLRAILG